MLSALLTRFRSQVVGDFHQASQLREVPIASRTSGQVSEPAFNHPQVRALHHQHRTMMTLQEMRNRGSEGSRSEVNPAPTAVPSNNAEPMVTPHAEHTNVEYLGDEHRCSICLEEYNAGEQLVRLTCRHTFHENCWTEDSFEGRKSNMPMLPWWGTCSCTLSLHRTYISKSRST